MEEPRAVDLLTNLLYMLSIVCILSICMYEFIFLVAVHKYRTDLEVACNKIQATIETNGNVREEYFADVLSTLNCKSYVVVNETPGSDGSLDQDAKFFRQPFIIKVTRTDTILGQEKELSHVITAFNNTHTDNGYDIKECY